MREESDMKLSYDDVFLREFEEGDIPQKIEWINDPENHRYLHYEIPLRIDKTTDWFLNKNNSTRMDLTIVYDGRPVGVIGLLGIDMKNRKAEYYITVGDKEYKRKGIGFKASKALLRYAFDELKLHKVFLMVDSENQVAVNLYEKIGFVLEGIFKDDLYVDRKKRFINRSRYAVFSDDFDRM